MLSTQWQRHEQILFQQCPLPHLDPLKRDIMDRNEVTQSPILPGTRWGGTRTEETEVEAIITEGKKVCIRWTVNSRRKRRNTERPLEGFREK